MTSRRMDKSKLIREQIQGFPTGPGLYFMKGAKDEVLYIGKAKNLRSRVASYFQAGQRHNGIARAKNCRDAQ